MKYAACAVVLLSCAFARASSIPATARSVQVSGVSVSPARFARPSYGPEAGPASAVRPVPLWPGLKVQGQVLANGLTRAGATWNVTEVQLEPRGSR